MDIINEILSDIKEHKDISRIRIKEIYLRKTFTGVQLSDGSTGFALNFDNNTSEVRDVAWLAERIGIENFLKNKSKKDNLLFNTIFSKKTKKQYELSVQVAILSALSHSLLRKNFLKRYDFQVEEVFRENLNLNKFGIEGADNATVIGYGGFIYEFLKPGFVKRLYVSDFRFEDPSERIFSMNQLKKKHPEKKSSPKVIISEGVENEKIIKKSKIVSITGSALCNNTLETLLSFCKHSDIITLNDHSNRVLPFTFFRRGVTHVFVTSESKDLFEKLKTLDDSSFVKYSDSLPLLCIYKNQQFSKRKGAMIS